MLGQAVAVAVLGRELGQDVVHGRPDLADQGIAVGTGGDGVPPGLQHELRAQVLPAADVLEPIAIGTVERVVVGSADVVGHRAAHLAGRGRAGRLDRDDLGVVDRDRGEQVADPAHLELGEELQGREGRVEVDVDRVVERVVETLEERELADVVGRRLRLADLAVLPERAAVDEEVQLVEEGHLVPVGPVGVGEVGRLPGLDPAPPVGQLLERVGDQVPGPQAASSPVARVALPPATPGPELDHRQVPGDREPDRATLAGREQDGRGDGRPRGSDRRRRHPRAVGLEPAVRGEVRPEVGVGRPGRSWHGRSARCRRRRERRSRGTRAWRSGQRRPDRRRRSPRRRLRGRRRGGGGQEVRRPPGDRPT